MDLWKRLGQIGSKQPVIEQPQPVIKRVEPATLFQNMIMLAEQLNYNLEQFESLLDQEQTFTLEQYNQLYELLFTCVRPFETIYELLKFEKEKVEQLAIYERQTVIKRQELLKQLENKKPQVQQGQTGQK